MLKGPYLPTHDENRMESEGDVLSARNYFFENRPNNLVFLLSQRFSWMNEYIEPEDTVIEIGSGAGFSQEFIKHKVMLTDYNSENGWIEENVDALNMPFDDNSIDVVISSHMIHHVATPLVFFQEINRVLKPKGLLLIHDVNTSLMLRTALRLMRHEGWSYDVDVYDKNAIVNSPSDPWSANCAVPEMLFSDIDKFNESFPMFKVVRNELCEFLVFLISGGVISKTKTVQLPLFMLKAINLVDILLIKILPNVFALGRRVVIQKK